MTPCDLCRDQVLGKRPVCLKNRVEPALLCNLCHKTMHRAGRLDFERDAEVFGYAY